MPEETKDPLAILESAIRERDDLNTFIKILQKKLGSSGETVKAEAPTEGAKPPNAGGGVGGLADPGAGVYPGMFFGRTQPQAVKLFLEQVGRPTPMRVVLEALEKGGLKVGGKKPAVNLWGVLDRNSEIFILVPKAGWALTSWFEPAVLAKMRKESGKDGGKKSGDDAGASNGDASAGEKVAGHKSTEEKVAKEKEEGQ